MSEAKTGFSFPRPRRELLAPLVALALAGCGASKTEEAPNAVNTGTGVAVKAESTPVAAEATPAPEESQEETGGLSSERFDLIFSAIGVSGTEAYSWGGVTAKQAIIDSYSGNYPGGTTEDEISQALDEAVFELKNFDTGEFTPIDADTELDEGMTVRARFEPDTIDTAE